MFRSYLVVGARSLFKQKGYSFINIAGLAVGMAVCLLILLWVADELSYDQFHVNADRIHLVYKQGERGGRPQASGMVPGPVGPRLKDGIPGIADVVRVTGADLELRYATETVIATGRFVDPSFLSIFSFPLIAGDARTALSVTNSVVVTEATATRLFGDRDPVGKVLDNGLTVTGVLADLPTNTHFDFEYLAPMTFGVQAGLLDIENWWDNRYAAYVLLEAGVAAEQVAPSITNILRDYDPEYTAGLFIQPLTDVYLRDFGGGGRITYVYIFGGVAVLILVVACINFINLATARSMRRAREIGLRKTVGAGRGQLITQLLAESVVTMMAALTLALGLVELALPFFNDLSGKHLELALSGGTALMIAAVVVVAGVLSGSYPAMLLSSFSPVSVLKRSSASHSLGGARLFRRGLVIFQFGLSAGLVLTALVIDRQLEYIEEMNLGIEKENILCVRTKNLARDHDRVMAEIGDLPGVLGVTATYLPPYDDAWSVTGYEFEGQADNQVLRAGVLLVDYDFVEVFGLKMIEGRSFSEDFATDETQAYIVNERAVAAMGMDDPIGKTMDAGNGPGRIVGVVKDFHFRSLYSEIGPLILTIDRPYLRYLCLRLTGDDITGTLAGLKDAWQRLRPGEGFDYRFFDELLGNEYRTDRRAGTIVTSFTWLAIIIAGMGLFGLAAYSAEQRTREIGIRKALGASVTGIVRLMLSEFMIMVSVAVAIALPLAYLAISRWLDSFAYRVEIGVGMPALSAGLVLAAALATVSCQAVRAARANPIESLGYE